VLAVELDAKWAASLRGRWPNVEVIEGDAARIQLPREPFRVVANLPFDRTTELLRMLFDDPSAALARADLIVEWGVAVKRGLPWPSTLNDVSWGAFYQTSVERRLPRLAFDPAPGVDAGVLVFKRRAEPLIPLGSAHDYRRFARRGFRGGLRSVAPARALKGISEPGATARDLDAHQWAELFLRQKGSGR
jgi:23S rRNA (adenine-N6)-dimethyltransferase